MGEDIILEILLKNTMSNYPVNVTHITKSRKGDKYVYSILNRNEDKPTLQAKWETIYKIEEDTWKTIYYSPFQLFIGTKLQWFQIIINNRILPTKIRIHKYIQITDRSKAILLLWFILIGNVRPFSVCL